MHVHHPPSVHDSCQTSAAFQYNGCGDTVEPVLMTTCIERPPKMRNCLTHMHNADNGASYYKCTDIDRVWRCHARCTVTMQVTVQYIQ